VTSTSSGERRVSLPQATPLLVLIRHGEAVSELDDPARPLSAVGRGRALATATWLAGLAPGLHEVRHSGKLRARQTAEIVAGELGLAAEGVRAVAGLAPHDDVESLAEALEAERPRVALVGHLPHLARLASRLLTGDPARLGLVVPDAAAVVLARGAGGWHLLALVNPDLL